MLDFNLQLMFIIKCHDIVVSTPTLYLGGLLNFDPTTNNGW
jgi:hypothetical protein